MLALSIQGFRSPHALAHRCSRGPLGPCFSLLPACQPKRSERPGFLPSAPRSFTLLHRAALSNSMHPAQLLSSFSTASKHRAHSSSRNSNPFMCLLHGSVDTPGMALHLGVPHAALIPFRITFFAHFHPLTLIESHSYEKHGGGGLPANPSPQGIRKILCSFIFALPDTFCSSFNPPMPQLARNGRKHNSRDCSTLWG